MYAALILHDDNVDISVSPFSLLKPHTNFCLSGHDHLLRIFMNGNGVSCTSALKLRRLQADNINTLVKAAGVKVEPYFPALFAKLFETKSVADLITNVGAGKPSSIRLYKKVNAQRAFTPSTSINGCLLLNAACHSCRTPQHAKNRQRPILQLCVLRLL